MSELKYWLWLSTRRGLGPVGMLTVLDHFVTPERAYYAGQEEYELLPLPPAGRRGLLDKSLALPDKILADCDRLNLRVMTFQDADYPQRLRQLNDPPVVLYIRGKVFRFDDEAAIGVVGARKPSAYGRWAAEKFGLELAQGGALLVSGIAEGADSCAIRGALMGGGPVVSLLAGGIDVVYPKEHRFLYEDVAAAGALMSEYPPGTKHKGDHYSPRNRILSGLCLGVLAVECKQSSGTMLTVNHAIEQNRDIFAVPGAINSPLSEGPNRLIQQGAKLVRRGEDILEEYWGRFPVKLAASSPESARARLRESPPEEQKEGPEPPRTEPEQKPRERVPKARQTERFTDDQLAILTAIQTKSLSADEIVERTQISMKYVLTALTMLQVQGAVEERPGRRFYAAVELE